MVNIKLEEWGLKKQAKCSELKALCWEWYKTLHLYQLAYRWFRCFMSQTNLRKCKRYPTTHIVLTVDSWDYDGPHECCIPGVGAFPVQGYPTGSDLPCTAANGVERVFWTDAVHHCPIFSIVRVYCQHLDGGETRKTFLSTPWPELSYKKLVKLCGLIKVCWQWQFKAVEMGRYTIMEKWGEEWEWWG